MNLLLAFLLIGSTANAANDVKDVAPIIQQAAKAHVASAKLSSDAALTRLDNLLHAQYGSRGYLRAEPHPTLRARYQQAAWLLMNGDVIAGGTLVSLARQHPAFAKSPAGPALASFVDRMLTPVSDMPELTVLADAGRRAQRKLAGLPYPLITYAQLHAFGILYNDPVAIDAGQIGLRALQPSDRERLLITGVLDDCRKALAAAKAMAEAHADD